MENKTILIDTLKMLSKDLLREKFSLSALKKKRNAINEEEKIISNRIKEIQNRIDYNLSKHGELLKE